MFSIAMDAFVQQSGPMLSRGILVNVSIVKFLKLKHFNISCSKAAPHIGTYHAPGIASFFVQVAVGSEIALGYRHFTCISVDLSVLLVTALIPVFCLFYLMNATCRFFIRMSR